MDEIPEIKLPSSGGSYTVSPVGELLQAEAPTADHPEGNRARDAEAKPTAPAIMTKKNIKKESDDANI